MNIVLLRGTLSSTPASRELPSGTHLMSYEVTTRVDGAAESVPVAWFDPPASAASLKAGTEVVVSGRVRRRFFRAGAATASRTEVVAIAVVPASHLRRVDKLVSGVVGAIDGHAADPIDAH